MLAMQVLSTSCVSCHTTTQAGSQGTVAAFATIAQSYVAGTTDLTTLNTYFVQNNLVLQGNPSSSWIYQALKAYGSINSMPQTGTLSASDANSLSTWISNIGD